MRHLWEEAPKIEIFGVTLYSFGLYCAIGVLAYAAVTGILCHVSGKKKGTGALLTILSIFFGLTVSRLVFCLLNHSSVGMTPLAAWPDVSSGGLSMFGMILGVFLAARVCAGIMKENGCSLLDIVSCALPLMIAAERFGEHLFDGFNISRTVKDAFPAGTFLAVKDEFYGTSALATWLVSGILALVLFLILGIRFLRNNSSAGKQWITFLLLCGAGGVCLESLRFDYHLEYSFVYFQQIISALLLLWGIILAGRRSGRKGLYIFALASFAVAAAVCGGVEFALDRMNISHILLYFMMAAALAVPTVAGIILLSGANERDENR